MAIYVKTSTGDGVSYRRGAEPEEIELDILADTEAEITALSTEISIGGSTWVSTVDNNVWEPGVYGWEVA